MERLSTLRARSVIANPVIDTVLLNRPAAFGTHRGEALSIPSRQQAG